MTYEWDIIRFQHKYIFYIICGNMIIILISSSDI